MKRFDSASSYASAASNSSHHSSNSTREATHLMLARSCATAVWMYESHGADGSFLCFDERMNRALEEAWGEGAGALVHVVSRPDDPGSSFEFIIDLTTFTQTSVLSGEQRRIERFVRGAPLRDLSATRSAVGPRRHKTFASAQQRRRNRRRVHGTRRALPVPCSASLRRCCIASGPCFRAASSPGSGADAEPSRGVHAVLSHRVSGCTTRPLWWHLQLLWL